MSFKGRLWLNQHPRIVNFNAFIIIVKINVDFYIGFGDGVYHEI